VESGHPRVALWWGGGEGQRRGTAAGVRVGVRMKAVVARALCRCRDDQTRATQGVGRI
jgi:hypothetical protein